MIYHEIEYHTVLFGPRLTRKRTPPSLSCISGPRNRKDGWVLEFRMGVSGGVRPCNIGMLVSLVELPV